ncbi:MAG: family 20 glycosylhydrolase [Candidatus Brocadiae bacterium]|nr:family 20 glycosylhydrolase [Candidatus Brocadiia bacterium]
MIRPARLLSTLTVAVALSGATARCGTLGLVPWPVTVQQRTGELTIPDGARIVCVQPRLREAAQRFAADVQRVHGAKLTVSDAADARPGDIVLSVPPGGPPASQAYRLVVTDRATIEASGEAALHAATITLLQAMTQRGKGLAVPRMTVADQPYRDFRALMIDVKNHWHPPEVLKQFIDLCRFYKVRYLSLHTGEPQWIGAVMASTSAIPPADRAKHMLYTKEEMDALIAYGKARSVLLFPHNESTPTFAHMRRAVTVDFNPKDKLAGWLDEVDGKGAYGHKDPQGDARFWAFIREATHRSYGQFAAAFPGEKLPFYHMGPVQGEGGTTRANAVRILGYLREKDPDVKLMFWCGPSPKVTDDAFARHKGDFIVAAYSHYGGTPADHLSSGYTIVNSGWSPLYIVGRNLARTQRQVFEHWNVFRFGLDGFTGTGHVYKAIRWYHFDRPEWRGRVLGGMLCTWEIPADIHFDRVRIRLPAFAEHAWHHKPWPYPEGDYAGFARRYAAANALAGRFVGLEPKPPTVPERLAATDGAAKGRVELTWCGSGNAPTGYRVLRSIQQDPRTAKPIAGDVREERYTDRRAELGKVYHYWVQAVNATGESRPSGRARGVAGEGVARTRAYEPFDYASMATMETTAGGGWKQAWAVETEDGTATLGKQSLSYGSLPTRGGAVRLKANADRGHVRLDRDLAERTGLGDTTLWMSFLVRGERIGNGHLFLIPNQRIAAAPGKRWGNQFAFNNDASRVTMKPGRTYFVAVRYDFDAGPDRMAMWLDPPLDREPGPATAVKVSDVVDAGTGTRLRIELQGWGKGEYLLDELRIGPTWAFATGRGVAPPPTRAVKPKPKPPTEGLELLTGPKTPLKAGMAVTFFGDSVTWQGGYIQAMHKALARSPHTRGLKVKLVKRGINGGKSTDLRDGCVKLYGCTQDPFAKVLAADKPAVAVIYIGINDVWHGKKGNPPDAFEACLRTLAAQAKTAGVAVVFATLTTIGEKPDGTNPHDKQLDQYAAITRKVAAETHAVLVDLRRVFLDHLKAHNVKGEDGKYKAKGILTYDGVHMLPFGNALLADRLARGIAEALRSSGTLDSR